VNAWTAFLSELDVAIDSKDCINWNMLTPPSNEAKDLVEICQGRFTGDPSHDFQMTKYDIIDEDTEDENVEEMKVN
jgi:radial spoke head protein 9